ncbi:MAG: hypothetical protein U5O39_13980 [Gammaproteobacteria bacterium]|nr:hypothetical protein [Gammaproteobacteria bacterium]
MRDPTETAAAIARYNKATASRFETVREGLLPRLSPQGLDTWGGQVLAIASSGWHAFGSADAFLDISEPLVAAGGEATLLDVGRYGLDFAGFSFEPGSSYFRGVGTLIAAGRLTQAAPIESAAREIGARFPQASSLLTEFFRTGFGLAAVAGAATVDSWARAGVALAVDRGSLSRFLRASGQDQTIDWFFVESLQHESGEATLAFLDVLQRIGDVSLEEGFQRLALRYASAPGFGKWLAGVESGVVDLDPAARRIVWQILEALPTPDLALALISSIDRLPLDRPETVLAWVSGAQKYLPLQPEAAHGYLALESAAGEISLEHLLGQVNFVDVHRVLQLFTEAISGARLAIEPTDDHGEHFRDVPWTDGLAIKLPRSVSDYPDRADNFTLYKVALLHQLGYYEFGTFDFAVEGTAIGYREYFRTFDDPQLAATLFQILEDGRIDWALERRYRGVALALANLKRDAVAAMRHSPGSLRELYLDSLLTLSLDGQPNVPEAYVPDMELLAAQIGRLRGEAATVYDTMDALAVCYEIIAAASAGESTPPEVQVTRSEADTSDDESRSDAEVIFRGRLEPDRARINQQLAQLEPEEVETSEEGDEMLDMLGEVDSEDLRIEQLKKGEVQNAIGTMIADIDVEGDDVESPESADDLEPFRGLIKEDIRPADDLAFQYDEWDSVICDYRRRWCTLYETRRLEEKPAWVEEALRELRPVAGNVRRQLMHLKPEMLRKVKGVEHGEELDLEKTVESVIDRRSGRSPEERIYVQRIRKDRDVSALFLLDMSASTDDRIATGVPVDASPRSTWDDDDFLHDYYGSSVDEGASKRIIDIEKEAVVLMADALEELGDNYAICGFSGYGREQVDFFLCKDFQEAYNMRVKGRIGGIKPCRSTRMGPAIRHATHLLAATESRTKALIIISDGYPQDFDYGKDRNSKDYGIKDTTMALTEARRKGIQPFCLTVDPSGHDYLR